MNCRTVYNCVPINKAPTSIETPSDNGFHVSSENGFLLLNNFDKLNPNYGPQPCNMYQPNRNVFETNFQVHQTVTACEFNQPCAGDFNKNNNRDQSQGGCFPVNNEQLYNQNGQIHGTTEYFNELNLPCQTYQNWDYNQCYSYYANGCYNTCQFVDVVDIEDFM